MPDLLLIIVDRQNTDYNDRSHSRAEKANETVIIKTVMPVNEDTAKNSSKDKYTKSFIIQ